MVIPESQTGYLNPYVVSLLIVLLGAAVIWRARNAVSYPPSPRRQWLIGNLLHIPSTTDIKRLEALRDHDGLAYDIVPSLYILILL